MSIHVRFFSRYILFSRHTTWRRISVRTSREYLFDGHYVKNVKVSSFLVPRTLFLATNLVIKVCFLDVTFFSSRKLRTMTPFSSNFGGYWAALKTQIVLPNPPKQPQDQAHFSIQSDSFLLQTKSGQKTRFVASLA